MEADERARLEATIEAHCTAERFSDAVTVALRGFGPEVLGYLSAMSRSEVDANDAFSLFCEDLWRGLPKFRWASSFRTWAYTLARHALYRLARDPERRHPKVAISGSPQLAELAVHIRTTTMLALKSEPQTKVALLREQLDPDDRTLLILRIDRKLSWQDIARVMSDETLAEADLVRIAATLRKRFERVKDRLRKLAAETTD